MADPESASKVIAGEPAKNKVKTMLVDDNGVDIEQMQEIIRKQNEIIDSLSSIVESRDAEDAEITRKLIITKSSKWNVPYVIDELIEFSKDELDDLHKHVCRVGRVDLTDIDESPKSTLVSAARRFPKLASRDHSENYDTRSHTFKLGK